MQRVEIAAAVRFCRDAGEAAQALRRVERNAAAGAVAESGERPVVFMFSGQGAQYAGMARELYQDEPSFRQDVDACCDALEKDLGIDLRTLMYAETGSPEAERLRETQFAQPALFVIEYALARLWTAWGIRPAALVGHSIGEYVAACLAGVFSLEDALRLVAARGRLMQELPAGAMLAVPLAENDLQPLLGGGISLAAINGPALCVASGSIEAIDELEQRLTARGLTSRRLHTSHAFHSAMMDPVLEAFAGEVARVERRAPQIPFISNVTGTWITGDEAVSVDYWVRHLRQPVRFADGIQTLLSEPARVFLEVGPGRTLASLVQLQRPRPDKLAVVTSVRHPEETEADQAVLLRALGRLWLAGVATDWS